MAAISRFLVLFCGTHDRIVFDKIESKRFGWVALHCVERTIERRWSGWGEEELTRERAQVVGTCEADNG